MANEMRDRLVEILQEYTDNNNGGGSNHGRADHLIENGVVVPPCKVGDIVYYIHGTYWDQNYKDYIDTKELMEDVVQIVECPEAKTNLMLEIKKFDWDLFNNWLNGEIFLTKAEAEQKLKEMRGE